MGSGIVPSSSQVKGAVSRGNGVGYAVRGAVGLGNSVWIHCEKTHAGPLQNTQRTRLHKTKMPAIGQQQVCSVLTSRMHRPLLCSLRRSAAREAWWRGCMADAAAGGAICRSSRGAVHPDRGGTQGSHLGGRLRVFFWSVVSQDSSV
jgi:hypothetical protein